MWRGWAGGRGGIAGAAASPKLEDECLSNSAEGYVRWYCCVNGGCSLALTGVAIRAARDKIGYTLETRYS